MERRKFSREFKLEAVKLVRERGERFCSDRNQEMRRFQPMPSEANPQIVLHKSYTGQNG